MRNRCNGCGSLHSGRVCYVCESARNEDEPHDYSDDGGTWEPVGFPKWLVAWFFFALGVFVSLLLKW